MAPKQPDPKPTKQVSPAILAARAFNRIEALIKQRDFEIARAPESISERYAEKIAAAKAVGPDVRELLDGMLEKAGYSYDDEGPVSE